MATLYVTEPGSRIEKEYRHLLVTRDDEVLLRVPLAHVDHVVLVGRGVGATTPAMHALLASGITLSLVSGRGELLGRLSPPAGKNLDLRRRQYARAADPEFCLAFARQVVLGKLHNYRALALRWTRKNPTAGHGDVETRGRDEAGGVPATDRGSAGRASLGALADALEKAEHAPDIAVLRGLEGTGSKAYFAVLRACLRGREGEAFPETQSALGCTSPGQKPEAAAGFAGNASPLRSFDRRTRRPPRDPVNALLSLGYTLLGESIITALEVVGLDPYDGFYHADKYGRPALALDLLEEFRGPVVDSVALTLINKRMLRAEDFVNAAREPADAAGEPEGSSAGVYLKREALRVYLREFTERVEATFTHPLAGRPLTYRKCLEVQARQVAKVITGEVERYMPLRVR